MVIDIYTDGSCHTRLLIGTWAGILFIDDEKIVLTGLENETTHNRMELIAVIRSIEYLDKRGLSGERISIFSDSQYVVNLSKRMEKLEQNNFITKGGKALQNADLLGILINQIKSNNIEFIKVKAHQKHGNEHNREVDMIVRSLLRKSVNEKNSKVD